MIYLKNSNVAHHIGEWFTPDPIEEIAFRLSHLNRFNGSVGSYSVAQHSVIVSNQLPNHHRLAGLVHDVCEAYIGDVTAPLKRHIQGYTELENFYCDVIDRHYGVEVRHPLVRALDLAVCVTEAESFDMPPEHFEKLGKSLGFSITPMTPEEAAAEFVLTYKRLRRGAAR